jgi:hypothetical protein
MSKSAQHKFATLYKSAITQIKRENREQFERLIHDHYLVQLCVAGDKLEFFPFYLFQAQAQYLERIFEFQFPIRDESMHEIYHANFPVDEHLQTGPNLVIERIDISRWERVKPDEAPGLLQNRLSDALQHFRNDKKYGYKI